MRTTPRTRSYRFYPKKQKTMEKKGNKRKTRTKKAKSLSRYKKQLDKWFSLYIRLKNTDKN